ncbi:hypothetical protein HMPREF1399_01473 [Helicobacter pylori GAM118Bi]|nr:hypothetical protein HMPREF1399_01473 [Helicobacter pylori GAM118Bi]
MFNLKFFIKIVFYKPLSKICKKARCVSSLLSGVMSLMPSKYSFSMLITPF